MSHVRPDKMAGSKGTTQAKFTGKNASGHNTSEFPGIVTGIREMGPSDAKEVEHSALRF